MKIMGIDPGLAAAGWGVIDDARGHLLALDWGGITAAPGEIGPRLVLLEQRLTNLVQEHDPDVIAIELVMGLGQTASAREVYMAIGVIVLVAANCGVPLYQYAVGTWKKAVAGHARAEKRPIQQAVQRHLSLPSLPTPDHAADALGVALHHLWLTRKAVA